MLKVVILCGRDRANGQGVETHDEGMGEEDEIEVTSAPMLRSRARPSNSADSMLDKKKTSKKYSLAEAVNAIASYFIRRIYS